MMFRFFLIAWILSTLSGCGSNDVVLDYTITEIEGPRIIIEGKTNLPPGTKLRMDVHELIPEGFPQAEDGQRGIEKCDEIEDPDDRFICKDMHLMYGYFGGEGGIVAEEGTFTFSDYGPDHGFENGEYQIRVGLNWLGLQPESVKEVIGDKGEYLSGPLVLKKLTDPSSDEQHMISKRKKFQFGGKKGLSEQRKRFQQTIKKFHIWTGIVETMQNRFPEARELRFQKEKQKEFLKSFDEEMEKHIEKAEIIGPEYSSKIRSQLVHERKTFVRLANENQQSEFERTKGHYPHWLKQLKDRTARHEKYY